MECTLRARTARAPGQRHARWRMHGAPLDFIVFVDFAFPFSWCGLLCANANSCLRCPPRQVCRDCRAYVCLAHGMARLRVARTAVKRKQDPGGQAWPAAHSADANAAARSAARDTAAARAQARALARDSRCTHKCRESRRAIGRRQAYSDSTPSRQAGDELHSGGIQVTHAWN